MKINEILNIPYDFSMDIFMNKFNNLCSTARTVGIVFHSNKDYRIYEPNTFPTVLEYKTITFDKKTYNKGEFVFDSTFKGIKDKNKGILFTDLQLNRMFNYPDELKKECLECLKEITNFLINGKYSPHLHQLESILKDKQEILNAAYENPILYVDQLFFIIKSILDQNIYINQSSYDLLKRFLLKYIEEAQESRDLSSVIMIHYYFKNLVNMSGQGLWEIHL